MEVSVIEMTNQSIFITPNLTELRSQVDAGSSVPKQRRYNTHEVQIRNPQVASQACRELVETRGSNVSTLGTKLSLYALAPSRSTR